MQAHSWAKILKRVQITGWSLAVIGPTLVVSAISQVLLREHAVKEMERDGLIVERINVNLFEGISGLIGTIVLVLGLLLLTAHRRALRATCGTGAAKAGTDR